MIFKAKEITLKDGLTAILKNHRARALYEKFGFEIIAERPNAFLQHDGSMAKEFMMQLYL